MGIAGAGGSSSGCANVHSPIIGNQAVSFGGDIDQGDFMTGNSQQSCSGSGAGGSASASFSFKLQNLQNFNRV